MMKFTVGQVMDFLRNAPSAEPEGRDTIRYYLHVTDNGELVDDCRSADETFTADRCKTDYFEDYFAEHFPECPKEDEDGNDLDCDARLAYLEADPSVREPGWGDMCAEVEDDPNSDFRSICEELTAQANAYLAGLDD